MSGSRHPTQSELRRGWCPGALTPMQTGDGWLVRVRPRGGSYSLAQLAAIAQAAHQYGNGEIDLTSRANLQIRGLLRGAIVAVQRSLAAVNLIDDTPAHEAARNILIAPLAGIDPAAVDIRPLALALEAALLADPRFQSLPSKFNFAIDGGGCFPLAPGLADITLRVTRHDVEIELAGAPLGIVATVQANQAIAVALSFARVFIEMARSDPSMRRMRDLVRSVGPAAIFARAPSVPTESERCSRLLCCRIFFAEPVSPSVGKCSSTGLTSPAAPLPASGVSALPIGPLGPETAPFALGIGLPFGRVSGQALFSLIDGLRDCNVTEVRPAPGRRLIVPLQPGHAAQMNVIAKDLGLITSALDPRLGMDVCPGQPACARGTTHTRDDAEQLARLLPANSGPIHISGCAKGCARQSRASLTFVARNGCYDVVTHGTVSDTPTRTGITSAQLAAVVAELTGGPRG